MAPILNQLFRVLKERLVVLDCYLKLAHRFGYSGCDRKRGGGRGRGAVAMTRGRRARRRDNELELGKSGNVVFFARFDLVILAIRNSLGSCGS
jgi:hypothetical protein